MTADRTAEEKIALQLANKIGDELDNTPHANNAEYVAHFERLMVEHVSAAIASAIRTAEDAALLRAETFCRENASATKIVQPLTNAAYDEACRDCADGIAGLRSTTSATPADPGRLVPRHGSGPDNQ